MPLLEYLKRLVNQDYDLEKSIAAIKELKDLYQGRYEIEVSYPTVPFLSRVNIRLREHKKK